MNKLKCSNAECSAFIETSESVSADATYSCRAHTKKYAPPIAFQHAQFDSDFRRAANPVGTTHIHNQGSDTQTSEDLVCGPLMTPSYARKKDADE
ncbi:Uncharacterised protein [uncultured archaeon]|nr:Uncharacterised protein [uncultured archaeon]